jgi:hypothetical protein
MMSEVQVHTIARQMLEKHGFAAIAEAAKQAQACESRAIWTRPRSGATSRTP